MLVVCIKDDWAVEYGPVPNLDGFKLPVKGNEYFVIGTDTWMGRLFYYLEGFPNNQTFLAINFRPIDDINKKLEKEIKELLQEPQLI